MLKFFFLQVSSCFLDPELQEAVEEVQELYQLSGEEAQRVLREEIASLGEQVGQQEKRAAQVSDWMYQDAQVVHKHSTYNIIVMCVEWEYTYNTLDSYPDRLGVRLVCTLTWRVPCEHSLGSCGFVGVVCGVLQPCSLLSRGIYLYSTCVLLRY